MLIQNHKRNYPKVTAIILAYANFMLSFFTIEEFRKSYPYLLDRNFIIELKYNKRKEAFVKQGRVIYMELHESGEMYLETIYILAQKKERYVRLMSPSI